jgi:hypothetical protein
MSQQDLIGIPSRRPLLSLGAMAYKSTTTLSHQEHWPTAIIQEASTEICFGFQISKKDDSTL